MQKTQNFLNPYEGLKQQYANNAIVNKYKDDWNVFTNQGKLDVYLGTLDEYEKKGGTLSGLETIYKPDFLSSQERLIALGNEASGDKLNKITKTKTEYVLDDFGNYVLDDSGQPTTRDVKYETTEYDYTKNLLNEIATEREKEYLKTLRSENVTAKDVGKTLSAVPLGAIEGIVTSVNDMFNIFEGVALGLDDAIKAGDVKMFDRGFRKAFTNDAHIADMQSAFRDVVTDPETGAYVTKAARYLYSGSESFGRLIPSILMTKLGGSAANYLSNAARGGSKALQIAAQGANAFAKSGRVFYYTAMASGNLKESLNSELCSRPTFELITNAVLKTTVEYGVERLLDMGFGSTAIDSMSFGYIKSAGKINGKNAVLRILKDALQEGTEEVFQDFGTFLVDRVYGIWAQDYKSASEWNTQVMSDAFIMGALMSLAGSTFDVMKTERIDTNFAQTYRSKTKTHNKGDIVYNEDGTVKTKKLSKLVSREYITNINMLTDKMYKYVSDKNLTTEERTNAMSGIYTTLKTITDVFGTFGEERYKKAAQMLDTIAAIDTNARKYETALDRLNYDEMRKKGKESIYNSQYEYTKGDTKSTFDTIKEEYDSFKDINTENISLHTYIASNILLNKAQLDTEVNKFISYVNNISNVTDKTKVAIKEKKDLIKKARITKVEGVVKVDSKGKIDTKDVKLTDDDYSKLEKLLKATGDKEVVIAKDGISNVKLTKESSIVVKNCMANLDDTEVCKNFSEQMVVDELLSVPHYRTMMNTIVAKYRSFSNILPENYSDADYYDAVTHMLYDTSFVVKLLEKGNMFLVGFIDSIYKIRDKIAKDDLLSTIEKSFINNGAKNVKQVLINHIIMQQNVNYDNLSFLSKEDVNYIRNNRWGYDFYNRVMNKNYVVNYNSNDYHLFVKRVDNMSVTEDAKSDLKARFTGKNYDDRISAINTVNNYYDKIWTTKFDGVTYPKLETNNDFTLLSYLYSIGRTLKSFTNPDTLSEEAKQELTQTGKDVTPKTTFEYYKKQFEEYTNNSLTLIKNGSDILAADYDTPLLENTLYETTERSIKKYNAEYNEKLVSIAPDVSNVPKLDIFDSKYDYISDSFTITDAITDFSILNSKTTAEIKLKYGALNSNNVYKYLNDLLMKKSNNTYGISMSNDNSQYVIVGLSYFNDIKNSNYEQNIENAIRKVTSGESVTMKVKDLIKDVDYDERIKNTKVIFSYDSKNTNKGWVDNDGTIRINVTSISTAYVVFAHEFVHLLQNYNNLQQGFAGDVLYRVDKDNNIVPIFGKDDITKSVIKDFEAHYKYLKRGKDGKKKPYATFSDAEKIKYISQYIYTRAKGEADAFGYTFDDTLNLDVFTIIRNKKGEFVKIVTPWGNTYSVDGVKYNKPTVKKSVKEETVAETTDTEQEVKEEPITTKKDYVRETLTKSESKGNNLQYIYNRLKAKGRQVILMDSRIKTLVKGLTPYMNKIDPYLANRIREGNFYTKSDVVDYIVNQIPSTMDARTSATIAYINKHYYKNENIKDGKQLDNMVTAIPQLFGLTKALLNDKIRNDKAFNAILSNSKYGDVDTILYGKFNFDELIQIYNTLMQLPTIQTIALKEYSSYTDNNIDEGLARNSLLNRFDGSLQSISFVAETLRMYNDKDFSWMRKPAKISGETSIDATKSGKREGVDKETSIAETIADTRSDIYGELGSEFLLSSLNISRDEKISELWEEVKARYLSKVSKLSNINRNEVLYNISTDGPLYEKLENMSDAELNKMYISYGLQNDLPINQSASEKLAQLAKTSVKYKARHQVASNVYRYVKQVKAKLTGKELKAFIEKVDAVLAEKGLTSGFNKDGSYRIPRVTNQDTGLEEALPIEKLINIEMALKDAYNNLGEYTVTGSEKFKEELEKAKRKVEREYKAELKKYKKLSERSKYVELGDMTVKTVNNTSVPQSFVKLLDISPDKYSESFVKYLADGDVVHGVNNMEVFQRNGAEVLVNMTTEDVREIIEFAKNSVAIGEDASRFNTTLMKTFTYVYTSYKNGTQFTELKSEEVNWIMDYMKNIASEGGQILSVWSQVCEQYNPVRYALQVMNSMSGLTIDEEYLEALTNAGKNYIKPITEADGNKTEMEVIADRFDVLNKAFEDCYENAVENFKGTKRSLFEQLWKWQRLAMLSSPGTWVRNIVSNSILTVANKATAFIGDNVWKGLNKLEDKVSKKSNVDVPQRLLTDEQKALVHQAENQYKYNPRLDNIDELNDNYNRVIETMNSFIEKQEGYRNSKTQKRRYNADLLNQTIALKDAITEDHAYRVAYLESVAKAKSEKISLRRTMFGQYKITGTKISDDAKTFIANQLFTNFEVGTDEKGKPITRNLYDLIGDALNKYSDGRLGVNNVSNVGKRFVSLIEKKIQTELFNNYSFSIKPLNELSKLLYKCLSDDVWVKKTFTTYLGKILTEDDVNLTRGITDEIMDKISDAYTMAAWDYMHKANFFSKMENLLRERVGEGGFFIYKQFAPFAVAGWNWFLEGLNYTPFGLAKAIIDYAKLDKKVEKMDLRNMRGEGPSGRFASYIVKRNIGKGIIGTIGFIIGAFLAGFGVASIDEDDKKIKLRIGNVYIDISNLFGTQGILIGMVMVNAFQNDKTSGFDKFMSMISAMLDQTFVDSTFNDMYSLFEYTDTFGEAVLNSTNNILLTFYPNIFKYFNRMLYQHKVKYSSGFVGTMQRDLVTMLPGIAYAFPKRVDPYTGDVQYKYLPGFWGWAIEFTNGVLPIRFKTREVSDIEKEAISNGVSKGELKGKYEDIGSFTTEQVSALNEYYGKLNKKSLNELYGNSVTYRVLDEKTGKYVDLKYSQMTTEQKKNVINRITADNANLAKVYIYTKSGGKYYTKSDTEYDKLKALGITNIYKSTKNVSYFN